MDVRIEIMSDPVLADNVYAPSDKPDREELFDRLRQIILGYDGPMYMGGDFKCTLVPRLDRPFASLPGRHDLLALRRLLGQG